MFSLPQKATSISDPAEREDAERAVKKRVMGNMRLISELYKQDMVKDWILITCIDELLMARTKKGDKAPPEANIEVSVWAQPSWIEVHGMVRSACTRWCWTSRCMAEADQAVQGASIWSTK